MSIGSDSLIPIGWHKVSFGRSQAGDKYWSYESMAWLSITVGSQLSQRPVSEFAAVIRR